MKLRAYLLMTFVVLIWGATFVLIKSALRDASPLAFNLVRMALAFLTLSIAYHRHWRTITRKQILLGALVGACLAIGYQFQTLGLVTTTPSKSAFLTGLVVVLVPLLSAIPAFRTQGTRAPRWNVYFGAVLAFLGILLLTSPTTSDSSLLPSFSSFNIGDLLTLVCALGFAFHCIALSHVSPKIGFQPLAILQIGFCTLLMLVTLPLGGAIWFHLTLRLAVSLLIAALLATAAAFSIQSWAQRILPPTHTALLLTMEPVFAWLTSFLLLGERLSARPAFGALLILGGIALTEFLTPALHATAHETA